MCLYAKRIIQIFGKRKSIIQKAHKDIVVYKVLFSNSTYKNCSIFERFLYKPGLNYPKIPSSHKLFEKSQIWGGWLHAYLDEKDALIVSTWDVFAFVAKMIIPKGTKYILGKNNDICASCLKWE